MKIPEKKLHPIESILMWTIVLIIIGFIMLSVDSAKALNFDPKPQKGVTVFFTSYNPLRGQTDSSPCVGASGVDQCKLAKEGKRAIALSQDLVGRTGSKKFKYGDIVTLVGNIDDIRCNGEFVVLDTLNQRYRMRGDLFFLSKKDNISCTATIYKSKS